MNRRSILSALCAAFFLCPNPALADTYGPYEYTEFANSITIDRYLMDQSVIAEVPATIVGKPVTVIGTGAFYDRRLMKHVILPQSIVRIEDGAFSNCYEVVSLNIPPGVTYIGDEAFYRMLALGKVDLPTGLTHLGDNAFELCWKIMEVRIPSSLTRIGRSTFEGCSSLTAVTIPASVVEIGDSAFAGSGLYRCKFLGDAPTVGVDAFGGVANFFSFYSYYWSKGFTYSTWNGHRSELIPTPDLGIFGRKGRSLKNGRSVQNLGGMKVGKPGKPATYTIHNWGRSSLKDIRIVKTGAAKGDFKITPLPKDLLKDSQSMTFTVTFIPKKKGTREASMRILSNDPRKPSFEVKLTGKGL